MTLLDRLTNFFQWATGDPGWDKLDDKVKTEWRSLEEILRNRISLQECEKIKGIPEKKIAFREFL